MPSQSPITDLYNAIADVIVSACPQIAENLGQNGRLAGVWDAQHASMVPWESYNLPYAVTLISSLPVDDEYSSDLDVRIPAVEIYYVDEVRGPLSNIQDALWNIRNAFLAVPQDVLQVKSVGDIEWGDDLLPNDEFLSQQKMPFRAGRVVVNIWVQAPGREDL